MNDKTEVVENKDVDPVGDTDKGIVNTIDPKDYEELKAEVVRLREHNDKVVQDRKDKAKAADDKVAAAEREKAEKEGDLKKVMELKEAEWQKTTTELSNKLAARDKADQNRMLEDEAVKIANSLAKTHAGKAKTLADILVKRLKLTDDGVKVTDGKGEVVGNSTDVLTEYAKKEYDYLCDGLQSTGGAGVVKSIGVAQDNVRLDPIARINAYRDKQT